MKKLILIILTIVGVSSLQAQLSPRVSYFMDKYTNRHHRNPALTPAWGYINFPALGGIDAGTESNIKLVNMLYPKDNGKLSLFMHPDVDADKFLRKTKKRTAFDLGLDANILGFGFYRSNDKFYSFDLNVKAEVGMALPKDLFAFLKNMESGTNYNITNANFVARAYVEAAFGHARDINEDIRVGGKLKFLFGVADARILLDHMNIYAGGENEAWKLNGVASGTVLGNFVQLQTDSAGVVDLDETFGNLGNDIGVNSFLGGYGGAVDLGVSYKLDNLLSDLLPIPLKGFTLSLGITDLGFITYSKSARMKMQGDVTYDGFDHIEIGDSISLGDEVDQLIDEAKELIRLRPDGEGNGGVRGLRTTTNLGLEYSFLNDKMSAGLLWSTHFGFPARYSELTLSYNLRPCNWFSMSLATSISRGFNTVGWAINLTPKYGLAFFFGMDFLPTQRGIIFDLPILPLNGGSVNGHFGMSIPIGRNRYHKYMKPKTEASTNDVAAPPLMPE